MDNPCATVAGERKGKKNGQPQPDDRKVLNGIFFVLRTGKSWARSDRTFWPLDNSLQSLPSVRHKGDLATGTLGLGSEATAG